MAKSKKNKKTAKKGVTTLDSAAPSDSTAVATLPKNREFAKDGTIMLKTGEQLGLEKATYEIHGVRLVLEGDVFIAGNDVNWLGVKHCTCKEDYTEPVTIQKIKSGHWVTMARCRTKKCKYGGLVYVRIHAESRLKIV